MTNQNSKNHPHMQQKINDEPQINHSYAQAMEALNLREEQKAYQTFQINDISEIVKNDRSFSLQ